MVGGIEEGEEEEEDGIDEKEKSNYKEKQPECHRLGCNYCV